MKVKEIMRVTRRINTRDSLPDQETRATRGWTAARKIALMLQRAASSKRVKMMVNKPHTSSKQSTCRLLKSCLCVCAQFQTNMTATP